MEEVRKQGVESLFCPYEQALKLKELEFDEECLASYHNTKIIGYEKESWLVLNEDSDQFLESTFICKAPLWQQAFRFFKEKYMLSGEIYIFKNFWNFDIEDINNSIQLYTSDITSYSTYEEAELECLVKLIEIVKKLQNIMK